MLAELSMEIVASLYDVAASVFQFRAKIRVLYLRFLKQI